MDDCGAFWTLGLFFRHAERYSGDLLVRDEAVSNHGVGTSGAFHGLLLDYIPAFSALNERTVRALLIGCDGFVPAAELGLGEALTPHTDARIVHDALLCGMRSGSSG